MTSIDWLPVFSLHRTAHGWRCTCVWCQQRRWNGSEPDRHPIICDEPKREPKAGGEDRPVASAGVEGMMAPLSKVAASLVTTRNRTGLRGVKAKRGKYVALIGKGRTQRWLGSYETAIEAGQAYDRAARVLYGTEARLNFPRARELGVRQADDPACPHGHDLNRFGVWTTGRASPACRECWRVGRAWIRARQRLDDAERMSPR
jgi:hypothetical protein